MFISGMMASKLVAELQKQIDLHGDHEVWAGGGDYPEGVRGVVFDSKGDSYHPKNCFRIH